VSRKNPSNISIKIKWAAGRLCLAELRRLRRERDRVVRAARQPKDAAGRCDGSSGNRRSRRGVGCGVNVKDLARMNITTVSETTYG